MGEHRWAGNEAPIYANVHPVKDLEAGKLSKTRWGSSWFCLFPCIPSSPLSCGIPRFLLEWNFLNYKMFMITRGEYLSEGRIEKYFSPYIYKVIIKLNASKDKNYVRILKEEEVKKDGPNNSVQPSENAPFFYRVDLYYNCNIGHGPKLHIDLHEAEDTLKTAEHNCDQCSEFQAGDKLRELEGSIHEIGAKGEEYEECVLNFIMKELNVAHMVAPTRTDL